MPQQDLAPFSPPLSIVDFCEITRGEQHPGRRDALAVTDKSQQRAIGMAVVDRLGEAAVQTPLPVAQTINATTGQRLYDHSEHSGAAGPPLSTLMR